MYLTEKILETARYLRAKDGEDEVALDSVAAVLSLDTQTVAEALEGDAETLVAITFVGGLISLRFRVQ